MEYEIKIKFDDGRTIELTGKQASELHGILDRMFGRHEYVPIIPYVPPNRFNDPWRYEITTTSSNGYHMQNGN